MNIYGSIYEKQCGESDLLNRKVILNHNFISIKKSFHFLKIFVNNASHVLKTFFTKNFYLSFILQYKQLVTINKKK